MEVNRWIRKGKTTSKPLDYKNGTKPQNTKMKTNTQMLDKKQDEYTA